jgi:hypothetical protein
LEADLLRTFDIVLIGVMTAAAAVTYTIKHRAELKLDEVHRLETEIKLEKDTIDLLKADWALLTQPNRLQRLINVYGEELKLQPTLSTSLAQSKELPMLRSQLPPAKDGEPKGDAGPNVKGIGTIPVPVARGVEETDNISTGSVED